MTENEVNFPRGSVQSSTKRESSHASYNQASFPKRSNKQKTAKRKRSVSPDNAVQNTEAFATAADALTYKKLQERMLLLGCIRSISPLSLEVELPGKTSGKIIINSISRHYTELLTKELDKGDVEERKDVARLNTMFHVGQFLPTRVILKEESANGTKVELSIDPQDINSDWDHTVFKKSLLVWAAVVSELDHGYQLDAGVANSRIFLPHKNVAEGTTLIIGQPLWCVIDKSEVTSTASTATVSILEEHINVTTQDSVKSLHYLIPGMQFNFTVTKLIKYGLEGQYMNNCLGYINEAYLSTPLDKVTKYREGQNVKARLLYVQPTIKLSHFTLRNLESAPAPEYAIGKKLRAQVVSKGGGGINIKLPNNEKGFVPYKRLGLQLLPNQSNLKDAVDKKYQPGSSHQCRILNYIRLEQVYICSFEQSVLKEKYFTMDDVKIGELVTVTIKKTTTEGLQVLLGGVNCFIQNMHLCDSSYSENIKKTFSKGRTLQARVWNKDHKGVHLTLKQALRSSDVCLSRYEDAVVDQQYPGVVVNKASRYVLVVFYNGVRGLLLKKHLEDYTDDMFYEGQVIMTTVTAVKDNVLHLSFGTRKRKERVGVALTIGEHVDGLVTSINRKGLTVAVGPNKIEAFVPVAHISSSLTLTPLLLETYKVGDALKDLLCISNRSKPILSLREAAAYKKQNLEIGKIEDLRVGSVIRCSYVKSDRTGIYVVTPFVSHSVKFKISCKELAIPEGDLTSCNFQPQQAIVAKVIKLDNENKISQVITKPSAVFSSDYQCSLYLLEQYLRDIKQIQTHFLQCGSPLAKLRLGQRVKCEVVNVTDEACLVLLKDNIQGLVQVKHYPKKIKPGQKLMGVVLWVNYTHQFVEVSLNQKVIEKINETQDGNYDKSLASTVHADVLINDPEYVIALLRNQEANGRLIFLPATLHENSFINNTKFEEFKKIKVIICRKVNGKLIGMDKQDIHRLKKETNRKRKRSQSEAASSKKLRLENSDSEHEEEMDVGSDKEESDQDQEISSDQEIDQEEESNQSMSEEDSNHEEEENNQDESENEDESFDQNESESDDILSNSELSDDEKSEVECATVTMSKPCTSLQNGNSIGSSAKLPDTKDFFTERKVRFDILPSTEIPQVETKVKTKKLSPAERKEIARLEEEELIKKEIENADSTAEPQTVEQFQKLVKGKPNCSVSWIKYVSHLVANAEIEKAKGVIQEALETISMELTEERYNIWIARLNLENSYGDKNTFNEIFEEAVRCNDDMQIYLEVIKILADSQKYIEMEEKIQKAKKKFKQSPEMWIEIGEVYYKSGKLNEARNLQNMALMSVNKKLQVNLVVKFAIMEFKYGEKNQAEALFETILYSDPKRVDVWTTYVDQVVKKSDIDGARRILERAVSQTLPAKKLKTLFKKFKDFAEKYDPENTQHVIDSAKKCANLN